MEREREKERPSKRDEEIYRYIYRERGKKTRTTNHNGLSNKVTYSGKRSKRKD